MTYLFLAYGVDHEKRAMTLEEHERLRKACLANDEVLRQQGHLLLGTDLQDDNPTVTVRLEHGELSLTEGTLCETKSPISELFIINARDLNEAIRLASQMPQVKLGAIEVRTLTHFERYPTQ